MAFPRCLRLIGEHRKGAPLPHDGTRPRQIIRVLDQTRPHGIRTYVFDSLRFAFSRAQAVIEKAALPKRANSSLFRQMLRVLLESRDPLDDG